MGLAGMEAFRVPAKGWPRLSMPASPHWGPRRFRDGSPQQIFPAKSLARFNKTLNKYLHKYLSNIKNFIGEG